MNFTISVMKFTISAVRNIMLLYVSSFLCTFAVFYFVNDLEMINE